MIPAPMLSRFCRNINPDILCVGDAGAVGLLGKCCAWDERETSCKQTD